MGYIIKIDYNWRKNKQMTETITAVETSTTFEEILKKSLLKIECEVRKTQDVNELFIEEICEKILLTIKYMGIDAVPIVLIAKTLGFKIFHQNFESDLSGFIGIGDWIKQEYDHDKVICVNINDEVGHQRFVIAHELAHYFFDYDGKEKEYYDTYIKDSHKSDSEKLANKFAAELLMPKKIFLNEINANKSKSNIIEILKDKFLVQDKAITKRLCEVITDNT